jgi:hypothetical protein
VLQRDSNATAVYGVVVGAQAGTTVLVQVNHEDGPPYSVTADVQLTQQKTAPGGLYARWKATLHSHPAGGNYSVSATCDVCVAPLNSSSISNVVFGDVVFCSGQSNMELPMNHDHSRNQTYDAVLAGRYSNIRLMEMGQNQVLDGQAPNNDPWTISPSTATGDFHDAILSKWTLPTVGRYAEAACRIGGGPRPKDQNTPCPECCSNGDWRQVSKNSYIRLCCNYHHGSCR